MSLETILTKVAVSRAGKIRLVISLSIPAMLARLTSI